jgi:hypothetical protein
MFPVGTVLRYYPVPSENPCPVMDWNHYTAIVMEHGIYHLKGDYVGDPKKMYDTVALWLHSVSRQMRRTIPIKDLHVVLPLPSATPSAINNTSEASSSTTSNISATKLKWNVPTHRTQPDNLWPRHIYTIIKECNPAFLQRTDIHAAYHHLMEGLLLYTPRIMRSYEPYTNDKYHKGIHIQVIEELIGESISANNIVLRQEFQVAAIDIMARYSALYNLIKHEVVPYMERKSHEEKVEKEKKSHSQNLQRCINAHTRLSQQHAAAQAELELKFKEKERYLQQLISEHQAKLDSLS